MRWLLISSYDNPGDTFIRIGVENLIRSVDDDPYFSILYKEIVEQWPTLELLRPDKIVWCGMPLFWSFPTHSSLTIFWRDHLLRKIMAERRKDFLVLGAGTAGLCADSTEKAFTNVDDVRRSVDDVLAGSHDLTMRDDCLELYDIHRGLTTLPCPAVYAIEGVSPIFHNFVCNLMTDGCHYAELAPQIACDWNNQLSVMAKELLDQSAYFAAHNQIEVELAKLHGFEADYNGHDELLAHLVGAKRYVGNRIHGAIVSAAAGAESVCYGYDLRLRAVEIAGAKASYFRCHQLPSAKHYDLRSSRHSYLNILREFMAT